MGKGGGQQDMTDEPIPAEDINPRGSATLPEKGDPSVDVVHAAVGCALCAWEDMEAELCWLYGAMIGLCRYDIEAIRGYSRKGKILAERLTGLSNALCERAKRCPDHPLECAVHDIIKDVKRLSSSRNKIAHATVALLRQTHPPGLPGSMINVPYDQEYCLIPAYYNHREVGEHMRPRYIYLSQDIRELGDQFRALQIKIYRTILQYFSPPLDDA